MKTYSCIWVAIVSLTPIPSSISLSISKTSPESSESGITRRTVVENIIHAASAPIVASNLSQPTYAEDLIAVLNLSCLEDLPPLEPDHVRVFMCRHGQTENNRLRIVQGARVDPPLNDTGFKQSIRLGKAFTNYFRNRNDNIPNVALHSNLIRAKETAMITSLMMGLYRDPILMYDPVMEESDFRCIQNIILNNEFEKSPKGIINLQTRRSLNEVDFGSLEGKSANEAKATMMLTFGQWALGQIEAQNDGGESGRSVLIRAGNALFDLRDISNSNGNCTMAFTHSTFLRVLLAMAMDVSLLEAGSMAVNNCGISVFDLHCNQTRRIDYSSNILGGKLSLAPKDFSVVVPTTKVVRINENRHLSGLL